MDEPTTTAATLLERIGWHPSDWAQIEVYARMAPARKVEFMLRWRGEQVRLLKERLELEHPGCSREELSSMLQEHLDLVRESRHLFNGR
ncbi:MAG TPA: hypothetical protein VF914_14810 [Chloroflexia bacterium]|jgi:hypothetical protein